MSHVTTHVLDAVTGIPADGLKVSLIQGHNVIAEGVTPPLLSLTSYSTSWSPFLPRARTMRAPAPSTPVVAGSTGETWSGSFSASRQSAMTPTLTVALRATG